MIQNFTPKSPRGHAPAGVRSTHARTNVLYVLIACEESQRECAAFRALGHIAFSCDIQSTKGNPDWHVKGDVTPLLAGQRVFTTQSGHVVAVPQFDLIIAHPPCTFLCRLSSVQLAKHADLLIDTEFGLKKVNKQRYLSMIRARRFFMRCLNAHARFVAVENPIPMRLARLPPPSCYIQPSWFGVKYTKKTLFWLRGLPPLLPEVYYPNPKSYVNSSRGKYRSRTFPQVADAIARQWSEFILSRYITA